MGTWPEGFSRRQVNLLFQSRGNHSRASKASCCSQRRREMLHRLRQFILPIARDRRGNVLLTAALALPVMVGGAGLAVDTAQWYLWKRELQLAADTGALSGAYA